VTPVRPRARKGEGELLRDEILEAAEALLLETGSEDAVSIRAVAQAVGVTAPSIYRHFPDKTHLLFEVCARQFELLDEVIEEAVSGIDDPLEAMAARGRAYVRFGVEHPEHYRIMFMGSVQTTPEQWQDIVRTGSFANLIAGIERLRDADLLPSDIDTYVTALHVWANIHGLTSLLVTKPGVDWPELEGFVEDHLEQCFLAQMAQARGTTLAGSSRRTRYR
jgi:AcrR family transcriptional regulator